VGEKAGRRAHRLGLRYALHICGRTDRILDDVPATGADALKLDYRTDARPPGRPRSSRRRRASPSRCSPTGVFTFIQEFQRYVSPGIGAAFVSGFAFPKAPPLAGLAALVLSAPVYTALAWAWPNVAYLHRLLATLAILLAAMALITVVHPLAEPRRRRRGGEDGGTTPGAAGRGLDWTLDQSCR
jgi:hypothetical protein